MNTTSSRLDVIDALRGFAIVSIMLLHNIEHFDLYFTPQGVEQVQAGRRRVHGRRILGKNAKLI